MRHPLWLVNATLLVVLSAAFVFVFLSNQRVPQTVPLMVNNAPSIQQKTSHTIDLEQIYENDLFNTYTKIFPAPVEQNYTHPMPQPPTHSQVSVPEEAKQPFLPPLEVTLKGILYVDDDSNNCALIADNKTQVETSYKIGEKVEDAQLIRIFANRVILIRSNGQQETLYVNESDIEKDPVFIEHEHQWSHIIKNINENKYFLDHQAFGGICKNLARFIDMFDLTTVYKDSKSIGCKVGKISSHSLGAAMGIESYDVITSINNLSTKTTDERYAIYQELLTKNYGDEIIVNITHNNQEKIITYILHDLKDPTDESLEVLQKADSLSGIHIGPSAEEIEAEHLEILKGQYKFAPTQQELKIKEKMNMLKESTTHG